VRGDIAEAETAQRVVDQAVDRFGRIDSLVTAVNLTGFFHMTQRVIWQMIRQGSGHIVNITASLVDHANSESPSALASLSEGRPRRGNALARHRIRITRRPRQRGRPRGDQDSRTRPFLL
jgi:NAD(P)-dependent dehydrogenase (short-subunit alcohol dehydrogenase family)